MALRARNDAQPVDNSVGPGVTLSFHIRAVLPFCSSFGGLHSKFYVFHHEITVVSCGRCFLVRLDESMSLRTPSHCLYVLALVSGITL